MTLSGDCISIFTDEDGDFVIEDGAFWEIVQNAATGECAEITLDPDRWDH